MYPYPVRLLQCTYKKKYTHILYIVYLDDNLKAGLIYGTWKVSAHHRLESDSSKKCVSQRTFVADNHRKIFNLDCVTRLILNWIIFCVDFGLQMTDEYNSRVLPHTPLLKSIYFKSNLENSYNYKISSNEPHICVPFLREGPR